MEHGQKRAHRIQLDSESYSVLWSSATPCTQCRHFLLGLGLLGLARSAITPKICHLLSLLSHVLIRSLNICSNVQMNVKNACMYVARTQEASAPSTQWQGSASELLKIFLSNTNKRQSTVKLQQHIGSDAKMALIESPARGSYQT